MANLPIDSVLYVSSITVFELYSGATDIRKRQDVDDLLQGVFILPLNAATALANDLPVKTLNIGHFQRISELVIL